jgi:hypothetical protein
VATGVKAGNLIQIVSGLRAGEPVIDGGNYQLSDGDPIKITVSQSAKGQWVSGQ